MPFGLALESASIQPSQAPGNFFQAGDFESLPGFEDLNELSRLKQRLVGSGIEPRGASAKQFDMERFLIQVEAMQICNFQLAASGRIQAARKAHRTVVIKIESGNRVI